LTITIPSACTHGHHTPTTTGTSTTITTTTTTAEFSYMQYNLLTMEFTEFSSLSQQ